MEWKGYGWWYMSAMQRSKSFEKVKTRRAFGWGRISPLRFVLHFSFFFIFYFILFFVPTTLFDQFNREQYTDALFMDSTKSTFQLFFH